MNTNTIRLEALMQKAKKRLFENSIDEYVIFKKRGLNQKLVYAGCNKRDAISFARASALLCCDFDAVGVSDNGEVFTVYDSDLDVVTYIDASDVSLDVNEKMLECVNECKLANNCDEQNSLIGEFCGYIAKEYSYEEISLSSYLDKLFANTCILVAREGA